MLRFRPLAAIAAAALAACGSNAQTPPQQDADPALWMVNDEDTTIYMLGTVHVLKPGLSWFDEGVKKAFDGSDEVVLEVVPPPEAEQGALVMKHAVDADGPPLTQKLPEASRAKYAAALASVGMPAGALDQFHPWFASTTLVLLPLGKLGYDPKSGVEQGVTAAAKEANKPLKGLETFDEQLGFFGAIPEADQIRLLTSTVDEFDEVGPTLDGMVREWAAGNPDALARLMNEQLDEQPTVKRILLTDRNTRWAGWIAERLKTPGTVFMAVGAGHLAGQGSVQDALKARGLTAERVKY
jgi:uncharacterized protein